MNKSVVKTSSDTYNQDETEPEFDSDAKPVSILVVDDLPEKLMVYEAILEEMGQIIVTARSGEEALKRVLHEEFAVILLDVNMPGMDGFETASLIRKRKKSSHTPIIFLTAFTDEVRMAQGYATGAVDYIPTPAVPEILRAKVRVFIELSQMRRKAASQAEERAMRASAEESARRSDFLVGASEILSRSRNQIEIIRAMARIPIPYLSDVSIIWLAETDTSKEVMEKAWKTNDGQIHSKLSSHSILDVPWLEQAFQKVVTLGHLQYFDKVPASVFSPLEVGISDLRDVSKPSNWCILVLPLAVQTQIIGAFILARNYSHAPYGPGEISLANDLASRLSVALENTMLVEKIQLADQRKDEFLAMLAHELRNPLAPINNALHVLKSTKEPEIKKQAEDIIERQLKHMVHLVDDLMDVSRITQGKIEMRKELITLNEALSNAVETAQPMIVQNNHSLTVTLPDPPLYLDADPARIAQIFANLLNNAAKYTNKGGRIELCAEEHKEYAVIKVKDNGIGISPTMLPRIFDMFSQVDSSLERTQGGLGIGLTLVKSLLEMHGGSIEARSAGLNQGSEFVIRLPTSTSHNYVPVSVAKEVEPSNVPLRILVVDDNEASAKTLGWMMEYSGHTTRLAFDGSSAIAIAKEYKPEVVLLDIGLPGMNGYDVCKTMRNDPSLSNTVFIAQTGWGQTEHRQRSKEAGFDYHLVKPVEMKILQQLLDKVVSMIGKQK